MKILHTADWHIGKKLHKHDLFPDFTLFIEWLVQLISEKEIELVLVSGDIFDSSNPSTQARKQFYASLIALYNTGARVIITGGNHDSPSVLNAPKELLEKLQISVIGALPNSFSEYIFPIKNKANTPEIVVVAIPFLRDNNLQKNIETTDYQQRIEAFEQGVSHIFSQALAYAQTQFPNLPVIAMGHLFASGNIATSESERDIQIGNQARINPHLLGNYSYIALGHIHKPQRLSAKTPTFYSGSPIPLSFSERNDLKRVLLIDTQKGFEPESISVPSWRKFIYISGSLTEIATKLQTLQENSPLKNLVEVHLIEKIYSVEIENAFWELIHSFESEHYEIVKSRLEFQNRTTGTSELFSAEQNLADLKPQDVFSKFLETQNLEAKTLQDLKEAFQKLVDSVLISE